MPLYQYDCDACGSSFEEIFHVDSFPKSVICGNCGERAKKVISFSGTNHAVYNDDAGWIKSVREVVDKDPSKAHCQRFLKDPTRQNYNDWMKGEGLRPMESGEKPINPKQVLTANNMAERVMKHRMKKNQLIIR